MSGRQENASYEWIFKGDLAKYEWIGQYAMQGGF